ncbi:RNA-directed DNA polymerase from mobile element jockey [Caerostris darwini]|uniref:RNA-directed DNA polymerase from mobile element jockey n=1 Tax=Caerostris darwini TaxID=1538125 RepID=A0AAV4MCI5_9ARAC|nr:RNA-directed DNA polymerase from mobile element jockey [Caerostris darwini]
MEKKQRAEILKPIGKEDGSFSLNLRDSFSTILKYHFPRTPVHSQTTILQTPEEDLTETTPGELEAAVLNIKPKKASGPEGIPGEVVKEIYYANPEWSRTLLNHLLKDGVFPAAWKKARIALIPKDGRDHNHPSDFRPICILPCWGKILDKILAERLAFFLETRNLLNAKQFGFRKRKSTINALQAIKDFAQTAINNNQVSCIISINIQNAFNSANWQILKTKIFNLNIPVYLKKVLFSFLEDRKVTLGEVEQQYNKGIPQGSSLGPILWNIFINDILELDLGQDSHIQAFADDILIMFKAPATFHFSSTCTDPLNKIHTWIQDNNLFINNSKSHFTIVSKKNYSHIPTIKIGNHKIKLGLLSRHRSSVTCAFGLGEYSVFCITLLMGERSGSTSSWCPLGRLPCEVPPVTGTVYVLQFDRFSSSWVYPAPLLLISS